MDNHLSLSYNPPGVDCAWQHDLETVGCTGLVKSVGVAAEGKGVLVLRYSKGTKDTSTTASPKETHGKVDTSSSYFISPAKVLCTLVRKYGCSTAIRGWGEYRKENSKTKRVVNW